eukprot:TRINITY_DN54906_c0_g1_i1.p1 TRINITY_DN54906_c0_g1~~TRINITY_DN54906_c0_g1_i1.p1  ORF type:complete len:309 (+),score=19.35 TRINITY_DN54906_c0_g1_i1:850-1776(+)
MAHGMEGGGCHEPGSSRVCINVGGTFYETSVDTMTQRDPDSMLAAMFSGRHVLHVDTGNKSSVFIDRDGTHFRHVLNWLRDGAVPLLDVPLFHELMREAEYYQLRDFHAQLVATLKVEDDDVPELSRKEVIMAVQSKRVRLRGVNLCGINLSKLDLSAVDFSFSRLVGTFFSRANLHCALFRDAVADHCNFHNAMLKECDFEKATLRSAVLSAATLASANFQDACLVDASLCGADLRSAHLQNADLTNANLSSANLEGANLKGAKLNGANLEGANLQRAYLRGVDLRDTMLGGANLFGANLQGATRGN